MEQYIIIAKKNADGKYDDLRILEINSPTIIPEGYEQIFGPANLQDAQAHLKQVTERTDGNWFGLTVAQYGLIMLITVVFVGFIVFGTLNIYNFTNPDPKAASTNPLITNADEYARSLITFLVAVSTVAIAFLAILTAMVLREFKERFALAKEVLTLLIGILGTIVGFYFGAAKNTGGNNDGKPTPTPAVSPAANNSGNSTATPNPAGSASPTAHILRLPDGRKRAVFVAYDKNGKQKIMMQWRNGLS